MVDSPAFEPPPITDDDIAWVCDVLNLPKTAFSGVDGKDPRLEILKSTETLDIEACPGSGKTTLLVAKLARAGGHAEIAGARGVVMRANAVIAGAGDIAVGGDGERARAQVARLNGVAAADRRARAGGHAEIGAGGGVVCVNAASSGAGDIAVGGDGERAGAKVARLNAPAAAADRAIGGDGDAAGRYAIVAGGFDIKRSAGGGERRGVGVGVGQGAVAGDRDRIAGGGVDAEPGDGGDAGVVGGDRLRGDIGARAHVARAAGEHAGAIGAAPVTGDRRHQHGARQQQPPPQRARYHCHPPPAKYAAAPAGLPGHFALSRGRACESTYPRRRDELSTELLQKGTGSVLSELAGASSNNGVACLA